ncbi:MAG: hypothetical protein ACREEL_00090 [Stellaceae bacterium]
MSDKSENRLPCTIEGGARRVDSDDGGANADYQNELALRARERGKRIAEAAVRAARMPPESPEAA